MQGTGQYYQAQEGALLVAALVCDATSHAQRGMRRTRLWTDRIVENQPWWCRNRVVEHDPAVLVEYERLC